MALSKLSGDEQRVIFSRLRNVLDPYVAVAFGSASNELWEATKVPRQQLKADYEAAAALGLKLGKRSCKELREVQDIECAAANIVLTAADLALLGTLHLVLPALKGLQLWQNILADRAAPDGVQRLVEGMGAGSLPAVTSLRLYGMHHVGDAGASALAAALGRGALPRLKRLELARTAIGDAGLVALAPVLRRRPALKSLDLHCNAFGDEGLAALVAPPPAADAPAAAAGAPPPPTGALTNLECLALDLTKVSDAGYATLAAALDGGALPALDTLSLTNFHNMTMGEGFVPASAAAKASLQEAWDRQHVHRRLMFPQGLSFC